MTEAEYNEKRAALENGARETIAAFNANIEAQFAAKDARIAELEAELAKIQGKAKTFLDEIEHGEGCQCFETAHDVVPVCNYCNASMALARCIPDSEDF